MNESSVRHATIVVERRFAATSARVFAAWRDPQVLERWYAPGDERWSMRVVEHEFRVGGRKLLLFGPPDEPPLQEDCRFEDIVDDSRICFVMTISQGGRRITTSMVTVVFRNRENDTEICVTDQLAILDGSDTSGDRERGWGECLDKLSAELKRH